MGAAERPVSQTLQTATLVGEANGTGWLPLSARVPTHAHALTHSPPQTHANKNARKRKVRMVCRATPFDSLHPKRARGAPTAVPTPIFWSYWRLSSGLVRTENASFSPAGGTRAGAHPHRHRVTHEEYHRTRMTPHQKQMDPAQTHVTGCTPHRHVGTHFGTRQCARPFPRRTAHWRPACRGGTCTPQYNTTRISMAPPPAHTHDFSQHARTRATHRTRGGKRACQKKGSKRKTTQRSRLGTLAEGSLDLIHRRVPADVQALVVRLRFGCGGSSSRSVAEAARRRAAQ